jgi:hypothetical protein
VKPISSVIQRLSEIQTKKAERRDMQIEKSKEERKKRQELKKKRKREDGGEDEPEETEEADTKKVKLEDAPETITVDPILPAASTVENVLPLFADAKQMSTILLRLLSNQIRLPGILPLRDGNQVVTGKVIRRF